MKLLTIDIKKISYSEPPINLGQPLKIYISTHTSIYHRRLALQHQSAW